MNDQDCREAPVRPAPVRGALRTRAVGSLLALAVGTAPGLAFANFNCTGQVAYLGIDGGGDLTLQLANSTPVHKICNVDAQYNFTNFAVASCKVAYATALSARLAGKTLTIYYNNGQLTCATLPSWQEATSAYFVQGPD